MREQLGLCNLPSSHHGLAAKVAMLISVQHEGQRMTNSTPNLVAWLAEYRKYLILVADGANDEAALLKQEIEEGLNWVELTWADLEFANDSEQ